MRGLSYVKIIVIAHGQSEVILCESIKSNLRIPMIIESHNNGRNSIQVNGVLNFLSSGSFKSHHSLRTKYPRLEFSNKLLSKDTKIFTIMDMDDCDEKKQKSYINGSLFNDNIFAEYITPIFNAPNLDDIMRELGYCINEHNKVESYEKVFPGRNGDFEAAKKLHDMFVKIPITNMEVFLSHCLLEVRNNRFIKGGAK